MLHLKRVTEVEVTNKKVMGNNDDYTTCVMDDTSLVILTHGGPDGGIHAADGRYVHHEVASKAIHAKYIASGLYKEVCVIACHEEARSNTVDGVIMNNFNSVGVLTTEWGCFDDYLFIRYEREEDKEEVL